MNKRIVSLCIILFILIMCASVNAQEITETNNTTNITNGMNKNTISTTETLLKADTTKFSENTQNTEFTSTMDDLKGNTKAEQIAQNANVEKNVISKQKDSSQKILNVKTDSIQESTGLNISGIVTTAYDKKNKVYAGGEEEGFVVEGAKISLFDKNTGLNIANTTSNSTGNYQFIGLDAGKYLLEFRYATYAVGKEDVTLSNMSQELDYLFVPDIAIVAFSGDSTGNGQTDKISYLKQLSDRILFLESYELNSSYDNSNQWMLDYANFILVDMYSVGNGFGVDTDLIAYSPASRNKKIAYTFGVFDAAVIRSTLANWGFLGDQPHSIENTVVGSYWQVWSTNLTTVETNMKNLFSYIEYLLGETKINPLETGNGPVFSSNSWGIYYPGFKGNVKTPSQELVLKWIYSNPGYNSDNAGSLNWMTENYSKWNLENNSPELILRNFEEWYNKNTNISGPFIIISTYYEGGEVVDALIKEYEKQGRAVFSIYKTTSEDPDMTYLLELSGNKSVIKRGVSAVSYMYWWTTGYARRGSDYTINAYKNLNVSLIDALKDISKFSFESEHGPQNEWTAAVTMPQFEGVFGALPVSYIDENKKTVIIEEGIAKHVQITNGWAKLRELNNSDKKISIVLYDYPPGKANIGASYLDVFQTLHDMLEHLSDAGYNISMNKSDIPTTDELNTIISEFGNKGQWAEGLLDNYVVTHYDDLIKHNQLVSKAQYTEWYNALPISLQEDLDDYWGEELGNGSMIYRETVEVNKEDLNSWLGRLSEDISDQFIHYWNISDEKIVISENETTLIVNKTKFYLWLYSLPSNLQKSFNQSVGFMLLDETNYKNEGYFLIPGIFYGNIFISVQPLRGWDSQIDFHNSYLPPPQQYVSYYKYLNEIFQNDAIIHVGTHGTLEWLPGRNIGLQSTDWPFQLIETPIIYPYIVSNPGEGMVAKERSFAQILTHMTPATASSSLYGDYVELNDAIARYNSNKLNGVDDNKEYYKEAILNLTESLGYEQPDYLRVSNYIDEYNIAQINGNDSEIEEAKKNLIKVATLLNFDYFEDEDFEIWLERLENFTKNDEAFENWLSVIHSDIEAMSVDKINFGMHTLGKVWNDTEMVTGVTSIVSSRTNVLDDIMKLYYPEIEESYYDKIKDRSFNTERDLITGTLTTIITNLVDGISVDEVAKTYGVFDKSSAFYCDLLDIKEIIDKIIDNKEWEYFMTALDGGYVEPGLSADPSYSDVLPTGRSMYSSDTTKMPSKSAWNSAVNSINQLLAKYMVNLGEETFPEIVAEVIWGTEVLRTEGISLAQFLYLLGVKPTWDRTGAVNGTEIIPLENLTITIDGTVYRRPRIDAFSTIVSNNPGWINMLTEAVVKVNELNETFEQNYIKKHYDQYPSLERLFGLPGAILEGTGVADLLNRAGSNLNESSNIADQLASVYEARISHSWNVDESGNIIVKDDAEIFTYLLEHVDLIIQNLDSTWRYLDSDDYADWFGGLLNAANVHGSTPNTMLLDIRDKNNIVINTLGEEVKREVRTTILNPQWLNGMATIVGGWNQMSMNFENLMKTIFTTQGYEENQAGKAVKSLSNGNNAGVLGNGLIKEIAKTLINSEYFNIDAQHKSYAFQAMSGWLLTLDMDKYWKNDDNSIRKNLLQKYVDNANRYGVACCHHTCGNINFHEWVMKTGAALGVKGLNEYSVTYASATKNPDAASMVSPGNQPTQSTEGTGEVDISDAISEMLNDGATGESNAFAMASMGATGVYDSSSSIGQAMTMTQAYTDGTGSGSNSDSTGGNSTGGNSTGNGTGSGNATGNQTSGNGTGSDDSMGAGNATDTTQGSNATGSGNGTDVPEGNSTGNMNTTVPENTTDTNSTSDTNSTIPENTTDANTTNANTTNANTTDVVENSTTVPDNTTNVNNTEVVDNSTDINSTDVVENSTTVPENTTDINNTEVVDNSTVVPVEEVNSTNTTTPQNDTNTTVVDDNTGAGETPDPSDSSSEDVSSESQSASDASSSSASIVEVSVASPSSSAGSSSSGGEAGSTSGSVAVYEVVKKQLGTPPTPQSEISLGYLLFIVGLLIIFFVGFTRPNIRK